MCDPTTIAIASFALAATGTTAQYQQSKYDAQAQNAMNQRNYEAAMQAYRDNDASLKYQQQMEWGSTQQEAEESNKAEKQVSAQARVAAGESGIMGNSVDALFREIAGNGARNQSSIYENFLRTNYSLDEQRRGIRNDTESITNGLAPVRGPSALVAGLKIGSAALNSYGGYKSGSFGKHGNQWTT